MTATREAGGVLVVFAKAPAPGQVKTRLCPPLLPEQAAELYACMLDDVLETSARAAEAIGLAPILTVAPEGARAKMARRAPSAFAVVAQQGEDLSARMAHAVAECAAGGAQRILLRGSDSPALPPERIAEVCAGLDEHDLVVCPDVDGGYSLLGLRRPVDGLFDHAMSHAGVLDATLERAEAAGLSCHRVEPCFDLDTAEDLARLAGLRGAGPGGPLPCPRTLRWLDAAEAWPVAR